MTSLNYMYLSLHKDCHNEKKRWYTFSSLLLQDFSSDLPCECSSCMSACALVCLMQWQCKNALPGDFNHICRLACVHEGYLYCMFGLKSGSSGGGQLFRMHVDRIGEESWSPVELPDGSWHWYGYLTSVGGSLLACLLQTNSVGQFAVFRWNQRTGRSWTRMPALPEAKYAFGVAVYEDSLMVIGGRKGPRKTDAFCHRVYRLCMRDISQWVPLPDLPCDCVAPRAAVTQNWVHLIGYGAAVGAECTRVLSMDMRRPSDLCCWVRNKLPKTPYKWSSCVVMNGHIVVAGGHAADENAVSDTFMYVSECRSWLPLPALSTSQCDAQCFCHDNCLYVLSGVAKGKMVRSVEILSC